MRNLWRIALPAAMIGIVAAQEPENGDPGAEAGAAEGSVRFRHWEMPEREYKRFEGYLGDYLLPNKKTRQERFEKLEKYVLKDVDGHSLMEDVSGFARAANVAREINPKCGRKGKIESVDVRPDVHGFPGGIGTVRYTLYLPSNYSTREFWPLIFCLPDNQRWADPEKYIEDVWVQSSPDIAERYILAVPHPQAKGDSWTEPRSLARAMIALRHVTGTFDQDGRAAGPATDMLRVFLAGGPDAQAIGSRLAEMFVGIILRGCNGKTPDGLDLRAVGGMAGVPVLSIHAAGDEGAKGFAERLDADNVLSDSIIADGEDLLGDGKAIAEWLGGLPPRTEPREIEYFVHDSSFQRFHWIVVRDADASVEPAPTFRAVADREKNEVRIEVTGIPYFEVFLNDALVDLDEAVRVVLVADGEELEFHNDKVQRDLAVLLEELVASNHPWRVYPVHFLVNVQQVRQRAARRAAEAAEGESQESAANRGEEPAEPARSGT